MGIRISSIYKQTVVERSGKLDVGELELQLFDSRYMLKGVEEEPRKWKGWLKPSCIPITIILVLIVLVVLLPLIGQDEEKSVEVIPLGDYDPEFKNCSSPCTITLVESIPENLTFPDGSPMHTSVFESWSQLIGLAERSIDIAAFYSTLKGRDIMPDPDPSSWQGDKIFNDLMKAGTERGIRIRIAQSEPNEVQPDFDTKELEVKGAAKVRSLDFKKMLNAGVLHTKMFLIDKKHFYIGSANMDWRSLTQVKELGVVLYNCSCLANDLFKIFEVYWKLGVPNPYIPPEWPTNLQTAINKNNPVTVTMNNSVILTYISSSPPPLCPKGRTGDLDSILDVINKAETFVYIAVMDYFPSSLYSEKTHYWPVIDNAIRNAAVVKRLQVRILGSYWNHTRPTMMSYLRSLNALNSDLFDIEVKIFVVPSFTEAQRAIPFARVNHNKYMVTDNSAYIGTSNWAEDYFVSTGGIGIVLRNSASNSTDGNFIREQVENVFKRDWASNYSHPISDFKDIT